MCAAAISRSRRARLYLQNLYPLPVYTHFISIMALQVDTLVTELAPLGGCELGASFAAPFAAPSFSEGLAALARSRRRR